MIMQKEPRVGVLGGGSWATALVKLLCNNLSNVNWWMRDEGSVAHIVKYKHNPKYLQGVELDRYKLNVTTDIQQVINASDYIVMAIPSAFVNDSLKSCSEESFKNKVIFTAIKGIIPEDNRVPARHLNKVYNVDYSQIGMISGPCHAEEVALERLSYLTLACQTEEYAKFMADALSCRYLSTNVTDDVMGTEFAAVMKNIYSIATGICYGLGYGDNFVAVLLSNAIQEMKRFIDEVNPIHRDVMESAYLGDLLVTSYSKFSRNRTFGFMIGKGYSVKTAQLEMDMIAEGYYASRCIQLVKEKYPVETPICDAVYNILYERISPAIEMKILSEKLS